MSNFIFDIQQFFTHDIFTIRAFVAAGSAEGAISIATNSKVALSVQQLIDCDHDFNRGCEGGNPLYAYQYIMANGLGYWDDYPYTDQEVIIVIRYYFHCI